MVTDRLQRSFTTALTCAAVVLALIAVRREFFPAAEARSIRMPPPTVQPGWEDALPVGIRVGGSTARVTLVVFSDLECPGCAAFHQQVLRNVLREHGKDVSMVFVHFPLSAHRFAMQAAQAAECALARGHFEHFIDVVYAKQDSLGMKTWGSYAHEAGISDTTSIEQCAHNPAWLRRIQAGRALGFRWGVSGTPTVLINGRRYEYPPTKNEVDRLIQELLKAPPSTSDHIKPISLSRPRSFAPRPNV